MRKFTLTLLATTAAIGLTAGAAAAADLPRKAPVVVAPPPPLWNWTGLYIGGNLGVGISRNQFSQGACKEVSGPDVTDAKDFCSDLFKPGSYLGSHNGLGVVGGGQIGYNWQFANSPVVVGIEGTYSAADLKGDHQNTGVAGTDGVLHGQERFFTKTNGIATITGRLGIASGPQDRTLWYIKGGGAWARTSVAAVGDLVFDGSDKSVASFSNSKWRSGWTVGTGVEWGLFDNWSAKIEYDYLDFGTKQIAFAGAVVDPSDTQPFARTIGLKQQIHLVTVGLNYRFNWWR
jgi:outer membrane immunogenic protein